MMMSKILKFVDFTKTQRFRSREESLLFFKQKNQLIAYLRATLWQKAGL